jgi:hypothetical protein
MEAPYVIAASVTGPLHAELGVGCQDRVGHITDGSSLAVAVADGLGSAPLGAEGARVAVTAAMRKAMASFEDRECLSAGLLLRARLALEVEAEIRSVDLRDLACTLIVCIARGGVVEVGHVGDGAVVARSTDGLILLSSPGESEYSNEVDHLAMERWESAARFSALSGKVDGLAAFTDGCQRAALAKGHEGRLPHDGFFDPIFKWALSAEDPHHSETELSGLLMSGKMAEHSEDDKTLAIAVLARDASVR